MDPQKPPESLTAARADFATCLTRLEHEHFPPPEPPPELFLLVRFPSPAGHLAAYLTPGAGNGVPQPVLIWLPGQFHAGLSTTAWEFGDKPSSPDPRVCLAEGVRLMIPSFRGGNDNPGAQEGFLGEVDDVLAAAAYLRTRSDIEPTRIYLGGHSTGGTLALLVAETGTRLFQSIIALGPRHEISTYSPDHLPFDTDNMEECAMRSPIGWLESIQAHTLVLEGDHKGNRKSWRALKATAQSGLMEFHEVPGADHFSLVLPVTALVVQKIARSPGPVKIIAQDLADLV